MTNVEATRDEWRRSWDERAPSGSSGDPDGTNGGGDAARRAFWIAYGLIALAVIVVCTINALSRIREYERLGQDLAAWQSFACEATSAVLLIGLAPLVHVLLQRFPPRAGRWPLALAVHGAATLAFSAIHVAGMVALRKVVFALAGERYVFGLLPPELLYEYRKDAATYVALAAGFWMVGRLIALERALAARRDAPRPDIARSGRLALRDGTTTLQVESRDILWLASAGNYVEFALANGRRKLIRGTLQR